MHVGIWHLSDHRIDALERQSKELQELIDEAKRTQRQLAERLQRLREGGGTAHTGEPQRKP